MSVSYVVRRYYRPGDDAGGADRRCDRQAALPTVSFDTLDTEEDAADIELQILSGSQYGSVWEATLVRL